VRPKTALGWKRHRTARASIHLTRFVGKTVFLELLPFSKRGGTESTRKGSLAGMRKHVGVQAATLSKRSRT
jgi:hypothetical protein